MMLNGSLGGVVDADGVDDYPTNVYTEIDTELTSSRVPPIPPFPDSSITPGVPVVRTEEALIVIFVMILWVAAIALFFNRWGKIRMLEPYQPKFHQEHRPSCPLVEHPNVPQQRMSFSKYNVNCLDIPGLRPSGVSPQRLRQNSVFVGSSVFAAQPPRKTKSAVDIHDLVLNERPPAVSKSMQPMICSERRPSCSNLGLRRMSGLLSPRAYDRRVSSCSDYTPPKDRHTYCNEFLSPMHCVDRRTSSFGDYVLHPRESKELRRPSFNNVIAQVTAERRPSSSMLRISNV